MRVDWKLQLRTGTEQWSQTLNLLNGMDGTYASTTVFDNNCMDVNVMSCNFE